MENEKKMLEDRGHLVYTFFIHSKEIKEYRFTDKLLLLPRIVYNEKILKKIKKNIAGKKIDIVHIHNIWPLVSPSVFFLFNKLNIPYLQTIHNYRYLTANALLYKDDVRPPGNRLVIKRRKYNCYKSSWILTFMYWLTARLVRFSQVINKGCGGLQVLNHFGYSVHSQIFNPDSLYIRGNFLPISIVNLMGKRPKGDYYLFIGRLSGEKGIETLFKAFKALETESVLKIAGTGPLSEKLRSQYEADISIEFVGFVSGTKKNNMIAAAKALIIPSEWHEVFPITLLEANFCFTPVIASRIGGLPDMIIENKTGLLFESGDELDLKNKLQWCEENPELLKQMGDASRKYAEKHFGEEENYEHLIMIYKKLISRFKGLSK
ncbi:glycosyltransferase family 4 protein [Desulfobacter hydrogenophilus]|uniref:glycosyltransferase family 4 protein n=1 Tax=Desulfobacter hydrogenophilus TaxID=2291 RepID=UPI0013D0159D|nr:glycosyltransferase [Desulfobacter hydrogenophilus]NDY74511.1 glycosyltransferase [Desulfobacter hydrogenophilus]